MHQVRDKKRRVSQPSNEYLLLFPEKRKID